jgi:hypothetical protein
MEKLRLDREQGHYDARQAHDEVCEKRNLMESRSIHFKILSLYLKFRI